MTRCPLIACAIFFAIKMSLTQFLAYQQYNVAKEKQSQELADKVALAKDKFLNILPDDLTTAIARAIVYNQHQINNDFDRIASRKNWRPDMGRPA